MNNGIIFFFSGKKSGYFFTIELTINFEKSIKIGRIKEKKKPLPNNPEQIHQIKVSKVDLMSVRPFFVAFDSNCAF